VAVLIDTNIFSLFSEVTVLLQKQCFPLIHCLNSVIWIELIQGSKSNTEIKTIEKHLANYLFIPVDERTSDEALSLIRTYSNNSGLLLADAFIAATCLVNNLELLTFNQRDFKFIAGLKLLSI